jgi:transposase, IS6 family
VEQDHRVVKKRMWLAKGYGSFSTPWRTLQGIEAMNMIRKGRVRWVAKNDAIAQATFVAELFDLAAYKRV